MLRAVFAGKDLLRRAAERLPGFREPALIVWAKGDRVMPPEHGRRLAGLLPQAQLIEIDDSYALIPLDQPARPAQLIADFTPAPGSTARATPGDSALPASKQTRRFSGWLLGGYLPLIWQPADAHRST